MPSVSPRLACLVLTLLLAASIAGVMGQPQINVNIANLPANVFPGSTFTAQLTFANPTSTPGYVPFIDLALPPYVSYVSVSSTLGQSLSPIILTAPAGGCVEHPLALNTSALHPPVCFSTSSYNSLLVMQYSLTQIYNAIPTDTLTFTFLLNTTSKNVIGNNLFIGMRGGFVDGTSASLTPSTSPTLFSETNNTAETWKNVTFSPARLLLSYNASAIDILWSSSWTYSATVLYTLAPGVTIYNATLSVGISSQVVVTAYSTTFNWTAAATPATDSKPHTSAFYNLTTSASPLNSAAVTYTFYVPALGTNNLAIMNPATISQTVALAIQNATLSYGYLDNNGNAATGTVVSSLQSLIVHHILGGSSVVDAQDKTPTGVTANDVFYTQGTFYLAPVTPPDMNVTMTLNPFLRVDSTRNATLTVPSSVFGSSGTTVLAVPLSRLFIDTSVLSTTGVTTVKFAINKFLQTFANYTTGIVGPSSLPTLTLPVVPFAYNVAYLSGGDVLSTRVQLMDQAIVYADATPFLTLAFGPMSLAITHMDGVAVTGTPLLIQDSLVTYRLTYTAYPNWKTLNLAIYLPYPLLTSSSLTFNSGLAVNPPSVLPPNNVMAFGPNNAMTAPTLAVTADKITLNYNNFQASDYNTTFVELYFTLQIGRTIMYYDRSPVTTAWVYTDNSVVRSSGVPSLVGTPKLAITDAVFYGFNTPGSTTLAPCTYCFPTAPTWSDCSTYTYASGSSARTAALALGELLGTSYTPLNQPSVFPATISNLQAGDRFTMVGWIQNFGSASAYNLTVKGVVPTGLSVLSNSMVCAYNLDGTAMSYTGTLFSTNGIFFPRPSSTTSMITPYSTSSGADTLMISHDMSVADNAAVGSVIQYADLLTTYNGETLPSSYRGYTTVTLASPSVASWSFASAMPLTFDTTVSSNPYEIQIGQSVTATLVINLPGGSYSNFVVRVTAGDSAYVTMTSSSVTSLGTTLGATLLVGGSGTIGSTGSGTNNMVTFSFGSPTAIRAVPFTTMSVTVTFTTPDNALNTQGVIFPVYADIITSSLSLTTLNSTLFEVVEPAVTVTGFAFSSSSGDANNLVTISGTVNFPSSAKGDVYGLTFATTYNSNTFNYTTGTFALNPTTYPFTTSSQSNLGFSNKLTPSVPAKASSVSFSYTVRVAPLVVTSTSFSTTLSLSWSSATSNGRSGSTSVSATYTVTAPTISLVLSSTDLTESSGSTISIGEVATYTITLNLPEGQTPISQVYDTLQRTSSINTLVLLDSTVVSIGNMLSNVPWSVGTAATYASTSSNVATWSAGSTVNIVNSPDDLAGSQHQIVFRLRAYAPNIAAIAATSSSQTLGSTATATLASSSISSSANIAVREPSITLAAVVAKTTCTRNGGIQSQCTVTSTVTMAIGTSLVAGYNGVLTVTTVSQNPITTSSIGVAVTGGGGAASLSSGATSSGFTYTIPVISGTLYNFTFNTVLTDDVEPGTTLSYSATLTYQSAPSPVSPVTARSYSTSASTSFVSYVPTPTLVFDQTGLGLPVSAKTPMPPGEYAGFILTMPVSRGQNWLFANISLPKGLSFDSSVMTSYQGASVVSVGSGIDTSKGQNTAAGTVAVFADSDGDGLIDSAQFNFGWLSATAVPVDSTTSVVVYFVARVTASYAASVNGTLIDPFATVYYVRKNETTTNPTAVKVVTTEVIVVEPSAITTTSSTPPVGDGADVLTQTITMKPAANRVSAYYNIDLTIQLTGTPVYVNLVPSSLAISASAANLATYSLTTGNTTQIKIRIPFMPYTSTAFITVSFQVLILNNVVPGQSLPATYSLQWASTSYTRTDTTAVRLYSPAATAIAWTVITYPPSDSLVVYGTNVDAPASNPVYTSEPIGATITYVQRVQLIEGVTALTVVVDVSTVANMFMRAVAARVTLGPLVTSTVAVASNPWQILDTNSDTINDRIILNMGTVTNVPDNDATNDYVLVYFDSMLLDYSSSGNAASVSVKTTMMTSGFNTTNTTNIIVIEPVLTTALSSNATTGAAGDIIAITLTMSHTAASRAHAYNVSAIMDNLPSDLLFDTTRITVSVPYSSYTFTGSQLVVNFDKFSLGASAITVQIFAIVQQSAYPGEAMTIGSYSTIRSTPLSTGYRTTTSARTTMGFTMILTPPVSVYGMTVTPLTPGPVALKSNVGERYVLNATVALIKGTFDNVFITLTYANALFAVETATITYIPSTVTGTGMALGGVPTSSNSSSITWSYNNVINTVGHVDAGMDVIVVTATVRLLNVAGAVRGVSLPFSSLLHTTGVNKVNATTYQIVEGANGVTTANDNSLGQGGTKVTTTVTVTPTALSNAVVYNLTALITAPVGFNIDPSTVTMLSSHAITSTSVVSNQVIQLFYTSYSYTSGNLIVKFTATVQPSVTPGQTYTTNYNVSYSSVIDATSSRTYFNTTSSTYTILTVPSTYTHALANTGTQYSHPSTIVGPVTVGEQYYFSGSVALLSATYSSITIQLTMPTVSSQVRMAITNLSLTGVPTGVSIPLTTAPVYTTASAPRGNVNSVATWTFTGVTIPSATTAVYTITFSGALQVVYTSATPVDLPGAWTINALYRTAVDQTLTMTANQVYATPTPTLTGWSGTNKEAGSTASLVYSIARPTDMGWNNVELHVALPTQFVLSSAPTTNVAATSVDTSTPTHIVAYWSTWAWSSNTPLTLTLPVTISQDAHPGATLTVTAWARGETAPGSTHSFVTQIAPNVTNSATVISLAPLSPSVTITSSQYQSIHGSLPTTVNVGELVNFQAKVPLIHGNYSTYAVTIYSSGSSSDNLDNALLKIVSASVSSVGPGIATLAGPLAIGTVATSSAANSAGATVSSTFMFNNIYNAPDGVYNDGDYVYISGTALVRNIASATVGTAIYTSVYYQPEAITPLVSASSATNYTIQDFTIDVNDGMVWHNVSRLQFGDVFTSTVVIPRLGDAGFGSNLTITVAHDAGLKFVQPNPQITSSGLTVSSFNFVDSRTLQIVFNLVPINTASGVVNITTLTFQSTADISMVPSSSYKTVVSYEAYTVPVGTSSEVRRNFGTYPNTASLSSYSLPILSSQPTYTLTTSEYVQYHPIRKTANVGEGSTFVATIAFLRGTTPSSSIIVQTDQFVGAYYATLDSLAISYMGPSVTSSGVSVGQGPSYTISDNNLDPVRAVFNFSNVVNTATGSDTGLEFIAITGKLRSRNLAAVQNGTVITGRSVVQIGSLVNSSYSDSVTILEGHLAISMANNATAGQAGDIINVGIYLAPIITSSFVTNATINVSMSADMAFSGVSSVVASAPLRAITQLDPVTLQFVVDYLPQFGVYYWTFNLYILSSVHPNENLPISTSAVYYSSNVPSVNSATRTYPSIAASQGVVAYSGPQTGFLSQPAFSFGQTSLTHSAPRIVNIGESISFSGQVALIKATFNTVTIQVAMPTTSGNYLMSIESLYITAFGATISGSGLSLGVNATSTATTSDGRMAIAQFTFNNVVNLPTAADAGNDVIAFSGIARVLNVDTTTNGTQLTPVVTYSPEGYTVSMSDTVTVVEGFLSQIVTATPSSAQGGDNMYTTIVISPTAISAATVYNLTVTIVGDTPILLSSPLDLTTSVAYSSLTTINSTSIVLVFSQVLQNAPALTISLRTVVQSSQNPGLSYMQRVSTVYYSGPSLVQPRSRALNGFVEIDIFNRPLGASRPTFTLNSTEFSHAVSSTVDIGEAATFDASVALIYSTFSDIWVNVSLPLTGGGAPRMAVEAAWVNFVGPYITAGNGIDLGTNATSTTSYSNGKTYFISFHFTNVVNSAGHADVGTNLITVRLVARVLNIAENSVSNPLVSLTAILAPQGTSDQLSTSLRIIEPLLTMSVATTPVTAEAGNQMVSTLSIPHVSTSNAAAYNVTLLVTYPTQIHVTNPLVISASTSDYIATIIDYHTLSVFYPRFDYISAPLSLSITSTVNETIRPLQTYGTAYALSWQSSTNVAQARAGSTSASSSIQTFGVPQSSSQPAFNFTAREYPHDNGDDAAINIGESVTFTAWIALMHATFDQVGLVITMPMSTDGLNTPLMAIETVSVSHIGATISGPDLAVGTLPVSQQSSGSYVYSSTFAFTTVVNQPNPAGLDLGDDYIIVTGTARVLNVPGNSNATLLSANATMTYFGFNQLFQSQQLMVEEGYLEMTGYNSVDTLQAGDQYQLVTRFDHRLTSTTAVYNITLTFTHPPEMSFNLPAEIFVNNPYTLVSSSAQEIVLSISNMTNGYPGMLITLGSTINNIAHPNSAYDSTVYMDYVSSYNVAQARKRNVSFVAEMGTYQYPQGLSQSDFHFGNLEYDHNVPATINIGESVAISAEAALICASFTNVSTTVFMPLDGSGNPLFAIESIIVSNFGPSITGPDLVLGAGPTSTVVKNGYIVQATFFFNNVINVPHGGDVGLDGIFFTGVARALDVPANVNGAVLYAYAILAPEGSALNIGDQLTVIEGAMAVSESSTPSVTDGGKSFQTVLTFSPTAASTGIVYNFTATITTPPELLVDAAQITTTSVYPFATLTASSPTQMTFRIPEYNYADGPFTVSFVTPVTTAVHPGFTYNSTVQMTYNSSVASYQSRMSSFSTSNSISILTDPTQTGDLTVFARSLTDHDSDDELQIGEDITYHYNVSLLSYTLASFNATLQVATGQLQIISATVYQISHITGISVGQNASIIDLNGDTILDTASFIYTGVVSSDSQAYVVFEMKARVTNSTLNVNASTLTTEAFFVAENLTAQYDSMSHDVVEPILNAALVSSGADVQKLDIGQSTPMVLTVGQDATSAGNAYLVTVIVTAPSGVTFDTTSLKFTAPYQSLTFATNTASSFSFTRATLGLADEPFVVNFIAKLANTTSMPGDLHQINVNVDYSSYPVAGQGRTYDGILGTSLHEPSAIAASYVLETGFPFFNASYSSDNNFNNSVLVVGERFYLNTVARLPSATTGMSIVIAVNATGMTFESVTTDGVGSNVNLGGFPTYTYSSDASHSYATITFPGTVVDVRSSGSVSSVFDLITNAITLKVPDSMMNQDGSYLTISATLNFAGGPQSRIWSKSLVLYQPTLMITAAAPTPPTTLNSPSYDTSLTSTPAPASISFDAGDSITGMASMSHFPGSNVRAENTSVYMFLPNDLAFTGLVLKVRGQTFDLSIQANWNLLTDGSFTFPPPSTVKFLQIFIGELQVGQVATLSYTLKALPTLQPGVTIPASFRLTWSSIVAWESGRVATRAAAWTLSTSTPYLPSSSSYGAIASTFKSLGSQTITEFPGTGKNLTVIGDINVMRAIVFLPEGTYNNIKITVTFDHHMTAQLQSANIPGGSFVTAPIGGSTSPSNMTAYFEQSNVASNVINIAPSTSLTLSGSTDGHLVPLIFYFASGLSDVNITQGAIITRPTFSFVWDSGNFTITGEKQLQVAQALFDTSFTPLSPVITPSAVFYMVYNISADPLSDAPAFQMSILFDLGTTGQLTYIRNFTATVGTSTRRDWIEVSPFNITYDFLSDTQLQVDIPNFNETSPPLTITLSIFAAPNITAGLAVFPTANLTAYSQAADSPGAAVAPRQKTGASAPTIIKVNQPPQIPAGTNLTYVIDEHTNLTLNIYDIYVTDSGFDNSTLFVVDPPSDGELTLNLTDASMFYKPNPWFYHTDGFKIRICDVYKECTQANITVIVLPVIDTPWIFSVNVSTAPITNVKSCTYPTCEGVWLYPISDSYSPDDVDLDPTSFKLLSQPQHGSVQIDVVDVIVNNTAPTAAPTAAPSASNSTTNKSRYAYPLRRGDVTVQRASVAGKLEVVTISMYRPQNTTVRLLYTTSYQSASDTIDSIPFEVCDVRGYCNTSTINVTIPGNQIRSADMRLRPSEASAAKCWPSYLFFGLSFVFGLRGPQSVNLMEHMVDYQQFIAYSRYMSGDSTQAPQQYLNFTDCYQWTMINLPDWFNFTKTHDAHNPIINSKTIAHGFYGNHILWVFIVFLIAMVFAYLVLVPIAFFLWNKMFYDYQISRTGLHWKKRQRLLYGLGTMLRYAIMVYLPVTFWMLYVERISPSAHIIVIIFTVALPCFLFAMWYFRGNKMRKSNVWNAIMYEAFNDFSEEKGYWIVIILARSILISLFVAFIPQKLVSVWIVFLIKIIYAILVIVLRPYTSRFSQLLDVANNLSAALACILFYAVTSGRITSTGLIITHYLVMAMLVIIELVSIIYHAFKWWKSDEEPEKKRKRREEELADASSASSEETGFDVDTTDDEVNSDDGNTTEEDEEENDSDTD